MGKQTQILINRFDGGMTNDRRDKNSNRFALARHFDVSSYPHKLVPYPAASQADNSGNDKPYKIKKFLYEEYSAGNYRNYGFGYVAAGSKCSVYYHNGTGWVQTANSDSTLGARNEDVFFFYKGFIYMWGNTLLKRYDVTAASAFEEDCVLNVFAKTAVTAFTTAVQPVLNTFDDVAYFFTDNYVHTLNNTVWTTNALTLPSTLRITAACQYGNNLAIACSTKKSQGNNNVVFLWDRDSSLTTLTDRLDFGTGVIEQMRVLNNKLIAVVNDTLTVKSKTISGNFGVTLSQITSEGLGSAVSTVKTNFVYDDKIWFPMDVDAETDRLGIWTVDEFGKFNLEFIVDEATSYQGIFWDGTALWVAHTNDGSVSKCTFQTAAYSSSMASSYESLIIGSGTVNNKLVSAGVSVESTGEVSGKFALYYRLTQRGATIPTAWVAIFTDANDSDVYHEAVNIESSGDALPEFREIQFRIESNSGAVITGLKIVYEEINNNPND
jgi:hypothetical protein